MEQATIGSANVFVKILSDAKTPASNSEIANIDKAPYTPNGVHDAKTDPGAITFWWTKWPDANIAIAAILESIKKAG